MKLYKIFLFALLSIGFFTACEADLDTELEDDDDLLAEDLFRDPNSYKQAIAGVYANLSLTGLDGAGSSNIQGLDAGTGQYMRGLFNLQNLSTDEVVFTFENDPGIRDIQRNTWSADNPLILGVFARASFQIALSNEFLRQTSDGVLDSRGVSGTTRDEIKIFRAEARVLRALAYYHLMDMFGKAPFLTENDAVGFVQGPQITRPEIFKFIEDEITAVQDDLLDIAPNDPNRYGRANKGVAKMILAKIYLNAEVYLGEGNGRYQDCLQICDELINSSYSLTPNYLYNFLADNNSNGAQNEIIFPVINDGVDTQNFGGTTILIQGQVGGPEANGADLGIQPGGFGGLFRVREQFSSLFVDDPIFQNDTRNTLITENRSAEITDIGDNSTGYIITKYSNKNSDGTNGSDLQFTDTDFPLFRLADVYLMYAEAHLRGGGGSIQTATLYVNTLRERAFGNQSANISADELTLDFLIDERARELYWESHRRQDLIRFGLYTGGQYTWAFKGGSAGGVAIDDRFKLFPIPASSLATNTNLIQNPGY